MKKLTIKVLSLAGVSVEEPAYLQIALNEQTFKSKVFKSDVTLDHQFSLGSFLIGDAVKVSLVGKRSGNVLATTELPLARFSAPGQYDQVVSFGALGEVTLEVLVLSRDAIRRSSSFQNIKGKLSRFLSSKTDEREEGPPVEDGISRIKHSVSHHSELHECSESESSDKKKLKRTASAEELSDVKVRRRRRKKTKTDDPSDGMRKKRRKGPSKNRDSIDTSPKRPRKRSSHKKEKELNKGESPAEEKKASSSSPKEKKVKREKSEPEKPSEPVPESSPAPLSDHSVQSDTEPPLRSDADTSAEKALTSAKKRESATKRTVILQPIGNSKRLFGVALEEVLENQKSSHPDLTVPIFFVTAAKIIREKGGATKGIFRIRGKLREVKELKEKIDNGEPLDENFENIHLLTTLMKAFLRELPTPILTFENYDSFIAAADCSGEEQIDTLRKIMLALPKPNYNLLKMLFELLYDLSQFSEQTQMTAENLAKVISPNLIWKKELDILDLSAVQDTMKGNDLAVVLIDKHKEIFPE